MMPLCFRLLPCTALSLAVAIPVAPVAAVDVSRVDSQRADQAFATKARQNIVALIDKVDIPHDSFTLPNGLRVIVHTDRSVPTVSVSVWYDVGSKHEAPGRSGFAHLFEHLMFDGSENVKGSYINHLMSVGGQVNGTTTQDRTNYYEVVPTQALERALFMESDRMGHLLGALTQAKLDHERGVVQNEKRNRDTSPTSIATYRTLDRLYPNSHPYGHAPIGSMKDLNAASLEDVRQFFRAHYGPNNATLILAGDIDVAAAKTLATRYFAHIPRGPKSMPVKAGPVMLARPIRETVTAPVNSVTILRTWPVAGSDNPDSGILDMVQSAMSVDEEGSPAWRLVREQRLFSAITPTNDTSAHAGLFQIEAAVRSGVDVEVARAALDRELALFLGREPTPNALLRSLAGNVYRTIGSLEPLTGRVEWLGDGAVTHRDIDIYRKFLRIYAAQTPQTVLATARRWLDRPSFDLTIVPGPRVVPDDDAPGVGPAVAVAPSTIQPSNTNGERGPLPTVAEPKEVRVPPVQRATLSNGMPVIYVRSGAVPYTSIRLGIDGGTLNEAPTEAGTMEMMYSLLDEGYSGRDELWISRRNALLGLKVGVSVGPKSAAISLNTPDTSLADGLAVVRDMLSHPTFPMNNIERKKRAWLDNRREAGLDAATLAREALLPLLNAGSPYNRIRMVPDPAAIARIDRAGIVAAFDRWVRPARAHVEIVSSRPLPELVAMLNATLGSWKPDGPDAPIPPVAYAAAPAPAQVVLVNLPGAVQALVQGGQMVGLAPLDPDEAVDLGSEVLGAGPTSRLNMNLREDKHWTYGSRASFSARWYGSDYVFRSEIQQDKVGPAIEEVMKEVRSILTDRPITAAEFQTAQRRRLGALPSAVSGREGLAWLLADMYEKGRDDDYPQRIGARYRAVTLDAANAALRKQLSADRWVWVIVGDAAVIEPQLKSLGMPVKIVEAGQLIPTL